MSLSGARWFWAWSRMFGFSFMRWDIQGSPDNGGGGLARKPVSPDNVVMLYIIHIKNFNSDEEMLYNITTFSNLAQKSEWNICHYVLASLNTVPKTHQNGI